MTKLLRYLKNYVPLILAVVVLLIVQAYCDLALPSYTSDIVDIGIQQGGIDNAAADQISASSMEQISWFLTDEKYGLVQDSYTLDGDIYKKNDLSSQEEENLSSVLSAPMAILYQAKQSGNLDLSQVEAAVDAGMVSKEQLLSIKEEALSRMGQVSDAMITSAAVGFVKAEYQSIGVDLEEVQKDYLYSVGGKMLLMTVLMMAAAIAAGFLSSYIAAGVSKNLRNQMFSKVISFSSAEVDKFSTASLITRCTNDIQQIQMTIVMMLRIVLYAPIIGIGGILKVAATHTGLEWIIAVAVGVMLALVLSLVSVAMPKFKKMQGLIDRVNLVSREILTGLSVIRAFGREKYEEERFDEANTNLMKTQLFTNRVMTLMMPMMMLVMNGITLLIVWFSSKGIDTGSMQVGDMIAFMTYTMTIVMAFMMITMISIMLPRAGVAAARVDEVLETEPSIEDKPDTKEADQKVGKGEVVFDHVTFTYPGAEHPVLKDISFTAKPGQTTAFIGSTGCGKSTLIHLLPRFYDVTEGSIRIDGVDIRDLSQHKLRSLLGFVPQKGVLFTGTIESNLKFGGEQITDEQMKEAASIAQAEEFISQKPAGYDSPISQGGTNVSGGQKQRLSIGRAIAKQAKIFLFDDSFSALDYKTDAALRKELNQKLSDATILLVAQRISTVLHAEQIIVLDEGEIVGMGTHEELLAGCPTYQEIARSQLSSKELGLKEGEQ